MILSGILAVSANGVIGRQGDLPWHIPEDMKFFKDKTLGHIMIMGRKTFEALPGGKPLPRRLHIVISRRRDFDSQGAYVVSTIDEAISEAKKHLDHWPKEVFVIGGGETLKTAIPKLDIFYLTEIKKDFAGDAFLEPWDKSAFTEVERIVRTEPIEFDFVTYKRK